MTDPEFDRSEGAFSAASELLDHIEREMEWNSQRARENPELHVLCQTYQRKLRAAADAITGPGRFWNFCNRSCRLRILNTSASCFPAATITKPKTTKSNQRNTRIRWPWVQN